MCCTDAPFDVDISVLFQSYDASISALNVDWVELERSTTFLEVHISVPGDVLPQSLSMPSRIPTDLSDSDTPDVDIVLQKICYEKLGSLSLCVSVFSAASL